MKHKFQTKTAMPYIILGFFLVLGIALIWPLQQYLHNRLSAFQRDLIGLVEHNQGLKLRYDSLNPSILLGAELSGFQLLRQDDSVFFSANRVRISYNLWDFLSSTPLKAVQSVELVGGQLAWDESRDTMFQVSSKPDPSLAATKPGIAWLRQGLDNVSAALPPGLRVSFIDTKVDLRGKTWQAGFELSHSELINSPEKLEFVLNLDIAIQKVAALSSLGAINGRFQAEGTFFKASRQIQAQVATGRIQTALGELVPQKFAAVLGDDSLQLRKVDDSQAFNLQASWIFATETISLSMTSDRWRPDNVFLPATKMDPTLQAVLNTRFTSSINAQYSLPNNQLSYDFKIDGNGQTLDDRAVQIQAQGRGNGRRMDRADLQVDIPGLKVSYHGNLDFVGGTSDGQFDFDIFNPILAVPVTLTAHVLGNPRNPSKAFRLEDTVLHAGESTFMLGSIPCLVVDKRFTFSIAGSVLDHEREAGLANLSGSIGLDPNSAFLLLDGSANKLPLKSSAGLIRAISALAGTMLTEKTFKNVPEDILVQGKFTLVLDRVLTMHIPDLLVGAPDQTPVFKGPLHFVNEALVFDNDQVNIGLGINSVDGHMDFAKDGSLSMVLDVDKAKPYPARFTGTMQKSSAFELQGPYGFYMEGDLLNQGIRAFARFEDVPYPALGPNARLAGTAQYQLEANDNWNITVQNLDVSNIAWNPAMPGRVGRIITRNGLINQNGGHFNELRYQDGASTLEGSGELLFNKKSLSDIGINLHLEGKPSVAQPKLTITPERFDLEMAIKDSLVHATIAIKNSTLQRFNEGGLRGVYDLNASFDSDTRNFGPDLRLQGSAQIAQAFWSMDPMNANMNFNYAKQKLSIFSTTISLPNQQLDIDSVLVDTAVGTINAQARYGHPRDANFKVVAINGSASWNIAATEAGGIFFDNFSGKLLAKTIQGVDGKFRDYEASFKGSNHVLELTENRNNAFRARIQDDGNFIIQLQQALPIIANISGLIMKDRIEANISNIKLDLATVSNFFNLSLFRVDGGELTGSLRVVGDLFDPELYGSLRLADMQAKFSMIPETLGAPLGYLVFEGQKMRLLPVQVGAGDSIASINGDFTWSRLNIVNFILNFETKAAKGVHIVSNFSNIAADGHAKGRFAVEYTPEVITLRGVLDIEDSKLQLSQDKSDKKTVKSPFAPEEIPLIVDLDLRSGKSVEFYWPSSSFPVLRTTLDINQKAFFSYNQTNNSWKLVGTLSARGGEIMYLKRNFFLRQASIAFNENESKDFDPIINARADTKIFIDNQQAKVSLSYRDCFLSNLRPTVDSDLAMSNDQLNAVISGDYVKVDYSNNASVDNLLTNSIGYASVALMPNVESKIRDFLGLDLFSLRSNLLANFAKSMWSNNLNPLDNQSTSLGKYLDSTTIQLGKFIGNDIYIELMAQFRAVAQTTDYGINNNPLGLTLDPELSMEWNTPFFDLQWILAPQNVFQPSLGDFIRNNTLKFSWQIR